MGSHNWPLSFVYIVHEIANTCLGLALWLQDGEQDAAKVASPRVEVRECKHTFIFLMVG